MKKLQRKHARMVIGIMACGIVAALASIVLMEINEMAGVAAFLVFIGFAIMALYCRFHFLKCPTCHRGVAVAHWNPTPGKRARCSMCKCEFVFDDEINVGAKLKNRR